MVQVLTCITCGASQSFPDGFHFQGQLISDWFLFVRGLECGRHVTEEERWERQILESARALRARWGTPHVKGEHRTIRCNGCGKNISRARRALNAGMAKSLIRMLRINGTSYAKLSETIGNKALGTTLGREEAKLAWWGLTEKRGDRRNDDAPNSGVWRVTERGEKFALGQIRVPSHAIEIGNELQYLDVTSWVSINEALKDNDFNFHNLMNGI